MTSLCACGKRELSLLCPSLYCGVFQVTDALALDATSPVSQLLAKRRNLLQVAGSLPWIGVDDPSEEQQLRADHAARMQEPANFQPGGPEKLTGAHDPQHVLQKSGGLADQWYMDDGDICVTQSWCCLPFLQDFHVANARVGAERNPLKTEVIYFVNDLDAAPPEWRIGNVRKMAKKPLQFPMDTFLLESPLDLGSSSRTNSLPKQTSFEPCTNECSHVWTRRQSLPSSAKASESAASTTSCEHMATQSC